MMKNWKKALLLCVLLIGTNSAYAQWQGNWLFGASGIFADRRGEVDIETVYTNIPAQFLPIRAPLTIASDQRYSDLGMGWGLLLGYQFDWDGWTMGVEGSVDWLDISTKRGFVYPDLLFPSFSLISWNVISEYRCKGPIVALSGRMAFEVAPYFIPYMRVGIEGGEESLDVSIVAGSNAFPTGATLHDSRWVLPYLLGVGFEVPIAATPVAVRAEYNYHARAARLNASGSINDGIINPSFTAQMSPLTNSGKLSIVWNFS